MAPDRRVGLGARAAVALGLAAALLAAAVYLRLDPRALFALRLGTLGDFLGAALRPALAYEAEFVPASAPPLPIAVLEAAGRTVLYAAGGTSLAAAVGVALGFLGSRAWWETARGAGRPRRAVAVALHALVRVLVAGMRSVHELLWAVLLLAAFGLSPFTAVVAIAIPYAGTLAKVYAELLDEAPRRPAEALAQLGAPPLTRFAFGLAPRALADAASYTFYRFECALRSAAVLGFFGLPTLGYHLQASWKNLHYRETWTYLYALVALVVVAELWSARLRRRFVA